MVRHKRISGYLSKMILLHSDPQSIKNLKVYMPSLKKVNNVGFFFRIFVCKWHSSQYFSCVCEFACLCNVCQFFNLYTSFFLFYYHGSLNCTKCHAALCRIINWALYEPIFHIKGKILNCCAMQLIVNSMQFIR